MASPNRRSTRGLIDQIKAAPYRFEFFQLVRLLRLHYSKAMQIDPQTRPNDDPLRFRSLLSLSFPPSEVSDLRFERDTQLSPSGQPLTVVQTSFMGLVGPSGVLPQPYTESLIVRHIQHRDDAAHAFLDLFTHRLTSLFYEAWQKYKFHIEYERTGQSPFERYLLNMVGFGTTAQARILSGENMSVPRELFSYFSGLLTQRPRNALILQAILCFSLCLPFRVKPFAGRWLKLHADQCTRLGRKNTALGQSALAGQRVWDYQSCVRIETAPLSLADYQRLQPDTPDYRKLAKLVRFYVGPELDVQFAPRLNPNAVPAARLGRNGALALGWLGWLKRPGVETEPDRCGVFNISFDGVSL